MTGKFDDVLARATSDLNRIAGLSGQISSQHVLDRLMVAVKGRRIAAPVGLPAAAILAKLDDIAGHAPSP